MRNRENYITRNPWFCRPAGVLLLLFFMKGFTVSAQKCPPNIDFETGSFDGWTCYTGSVAAINGENVISLIPSGGPLTDRHTMYTASQNKALDPYGGFPVNCPNGSGHSIKLGNDFGGGQAEGISYQFTIPANENKYSMIYNYAVVFQDPNHLQYQQPRMEIEVMNVTDGQIIQCSSFTFVPYGTPLPGFYESPTPGGPTPVWCKNWTAVSINLDNLAGKTIRLFFKTADCTFTRHFGYAYIDVNSECSGTFLGATFCKDDSVVNVVAPYGYESYTWYDSSLTNVLGNQQTLALSPLPKPGTVIGVKVQPYDGYGCPQVLYARLADTLTVKAFAGPDDLSCNENPVQLGKPPQPGLVYSWLPETGLSSASVSNPIATPAVTTDYILSARNSGGGCLSKDTVTIIASVISTSLKLIGKATYCIGSGDSSILRVEPADSIQWFKDNTAIRGANKVDLKVTESGNYFAVVTNDMGCNVATERKTIFIDKARPAIRYPVQYAIENMPTSLEARNFGNSVSWSPGTSLDNRSSVTPVFSGPSEQQYLVAITTESGCLTVDTALVKTVKGVEIHVPSAFTPNGDGLNDVLRPVLMAVKELKYFRVYNRWGELLFESATAQKGWDGKLRGTPQGSGVVVWIVEGVGVDGKTYRKKGTTALVR